MNGEVRLWLDQGFDGDADVYLPVEAARLHGVSADKPTHIALSAAEFEAWKRVMLAARCWRDTVIFPNEENGSEVDLCAAVDALPRDQQPGRAVEGT